MKETQKKKISEFFYHDWMDEHSKVEQFLNALEDAGLTDNQTLKQEDALITFLDETQEKIFLNGLYGSESGYRIQTAEKETFLSVLDRKSMEELPEEIVNLASRLIGEVETESRHLNRELKFLLQSNL